MPPAHEALDRVDGAARVGDRLPLGRVADQPIALVGEGHHAGRQAVAFLIGDDLDLAAFHDRHDRVRRAQVDADDFFFCHLVVLLSERPSTSACSRRKLSAAVVCSARDRARFRMILRRIRRVILCRSRPRKKRGKYVAKPVPRDCDRCTVPQASAVMGLNANRFSPLVLNADTGNSFTAKMTGGRRAWRHPWVNVADHEQFARRVQAAKVANMLELCGSIR